MIKCPTCGKDCKNATGLANHVKVHYDVLNQGNGLVGPKKTNEEIRDFLGVNRKKNIKL